MVGPYCHKISTLGSMDPLFQSFITLLSTGTASLSSTKSKDLKISMDFDGEAEDILQQVYDVYGPLADMSFRTLRTGRKVPGSLLVCRDSLAQ